MISFTPTLNCSQLHNSLLNDGIVFLIRSNYSMSIELTGISHHQEKRHDKYNWSLIHNTH